MTISIVNQKGGTGKTTTTVNLGKALTLQGLKVLLIDLDPQGNLSYSLAIHGESDTITSIIDGTLGLHDVAVTREQMGVIPANINLAQFEFNRINKQAFVLKNVLDKSLHYDHILIDCPPALSWLTLNALVASTAVLVPMQLDVFSIQGLRQIMNTVEEVRTKYHTNLEILGVLAVMVDWRKKLTHEVLNHVRQEFHIKVFDTFIRTNVKAAEAPSFGKSVINYASGSSSANDYRALAEELAVVMAQ